VEGEGLSLRPLGLTLLAGFAIANVAPARGEDFWARFLGAAPGKAKAFACFTRVYDAQHLAKHPLQNVKAMRLLAFVDPAAPGEIELRFQASFRTRKGVLATISYCTPPEAGDTAKVIHCSVPCDGGAIDISLEANGSALLSVPNGARLWTPGSHDPTEDDPDADVRGAFGPDDKLFRLDRAGAPQCLSLAFDAKEKAAMKGLK